MKKTLTLIFLICTFNIQASAYDEANWYISLDVAQVQSKLVPFLPKAKANKVEFSINEHLPDGLEQVTLYGHSDVENDLSVAVTGDFSNFAFNDYLINLMYLADDDRDADVSLFATESYQGRSIEEYRITDGNESKSFFSSQVSSELLILSFEANEVKNWIDNKYSTFELKNSGMVSVLVNIESAMAHMGADLKSHPKGKDVPFRSAMLNKVNQFSASVFDSGDDMSIDAALSTADAATAKQLEQVINGLIAMNALSGLDQKSPALASLFGSLKISNHGSDLLLSASLPYQLLHDLK